MTARKKKAPSLPHPKVLRVMLSDLGRKVIDLERQLAERSAELRRLQARNADLAARVPVDVSRARREMERHR